MSVAHKRAILVQQRSINIILLQLTNESGLIKEPNSRLKADRAHRWWDTSHPRLPLCSWELVNVFFPLRSCKSGCIKITMLKRQLLKSNKICLVPSQGKWHASVFYFFSNWAKKEGLWLQVCGRDLWQCMLAVCKILIHARVTMLTAVHYIYICNQKRKKESKQCFG